MKVILQHALIAQGSGVLNHRSGFMNVRVNCRACNGNGKVIMTACSGCSGSGSNEQTKSIKVSIPSGVSDGNHLRVPGEGNLTPEAVEPGRPHDKAIY